jgi:sugar phosphate isomerase/epimerase
MKIGLKIKYTRNAPLVLPHLDRLRGQIDYFELGTRPEEDFRQFEILKDQGFSFTVHAPMQENDVNIAEPKKDLSNRHGIDIAREAADLFDAPAIIIHPGDIETENSSIDHMVALLKEYHDSRFYIENLPDKASSLPYRRIAYNIIDLKYTKEKARTGFCLDFGHALMQAWREKREYYGYIEEITRELRPTYFHLHNGDGLEDKHWSISCKEGFIDYKKVAHLWSKNAMLTLEIAVFDKNNIFDVETVLRDVDYLRNLLIDKGKII